MKSLMAVALVGLVACAPGCIFADFDVRLLTDYTAPLQEYTLSGSGDEKLAVIPVAGFINNKPDEAFIGGAKPSVVQDVVAQLKLARRDPAVKAVILQIDTPGGSVTASDMIYREVMEFKRRTGTKVVAAMMDMATSGGYYVAAAADRIVAHPTTVTGSIGVIFLRGNVVGLMDMIGVDARVTKSGPHKDMGSPFRQSTEEEDRIFQAMIDEYFERFAGIVAASRGLPLERVAELADGRVYTGTQALAVGLVDRVGYIDDALAEAKELADLPKNARVVVYRRTEPADGTAYSTADAAGQKAALVDLGLDRFLPDFRTGFYYLWLPEL